MHISAGGIARDDEKAGWDVRLGDGAESFPFNSVLQLSAASDKPKDYQPFDMPMAHIECHDEQATISNTELVVFEIREEHPDET